MQRSSGGDGVEEFLRTVRAMKANKQDQYELAGDFVLVAHIATREHDEIDYRACSSWCDLRRAFCEFFSEKAQNAARLDIEW